MSFSVFLVVLTFFGGFLAILVAAYIAAYIMDLCSKPGEQRRRIDHQIELAATRNMCADVRIETLEKLFPTNKVRTWYMVCLDK